jgi:hypothetical protein
MQKLLIYSSVGGYTMLAGNADEDGIEIALFIDPLRGYSNRGY